MAKEATPTLCPGCGSEGPFSKPRYEKGGGWGMFFTGGFWGWLQRDLAREEEWQCEACRVIFRAPGGASRRLPWLVALGPWVFVVISPIIIVVLILTFGDGFARLTSHEHAIEVGTTLLALAAVLVIAWMRLWKRRGGGGAG